MSEDLTAPAGAPQTEEVPKKKGIDWDKEDLTTGSHHEIARRLGVHHTTVKAVRDARGITSAEKGGRPPTSDKEPTVGKGIRLLGSQWAELDAAAAEEGTTRPKLHARIITEWLEQWRKRSKKR